MIFLGKKVKFIKIRIYEASYFNEVHKTYVLFNSHQVKATYTEISCFYKNLAACSSEIQNSS